jgi:YfiH family protein
MPTPLTADSLAALPGIAHGFFTRHGGVSRGGYASLNCGLGSKDDPAAVRENRARVTAALAARSLVTAHQVHSAAAVVVEEPWSGAERPRVDAIATATTGLAVGVLTADCAPVLLADPQAGVVAAAHAGWRGAIGGVLEAAITAMETLGARRARIQAAVGPCIGPAAYQVGHEFEQEFLARDPASTRFFARPDGGAAARPHFDLPGYVLDRLARAGLAPGRTAPCSFAAEGDFFSYRRSQARKEIDYGRQISAIVLT